MINFINSRISGRRINSQSSVEILLSKGGSNRNPYYVIASIDDNYVGIFQIATIQLNGIEVTSIIEGEKIVYKF